MEAALDDFVRDAERLEDLRALVGLQRRDAHLGHDLEHALGDGLAIIADGVGRPCRAGRRRATVEQRLEREVRVDAVGAVADEQAEW